MPDEVTKDDPRVQKLLGFKSLTREDLAVLVVTGTDALEAERESRSPAPPPSALTGEELYERWNRLLIDSGAEPRPWSRMASEDPRESCLWEDLAAQLVRPSTLTDEAVKEVTKQIVEGADGEVISLPYAVVRDALEGVFGVQAPTLTDEERERLELIAKRCDNRVRWAPDRESREFNREDAAFLRTLAGKEQR
jgi:hypothetical protein